MINLRPFMSSKEKADEWASRCGFRMDRTYRIGGYRYATDGAIIVRVVDPGPDTARGEQLTIAFPFKKFPIGKRLRKLPHYRERTRTALGTLLERVGACWVDVEYLSSIEPLPNLRVCPHGKKYVGFVFDGGEGIVIGCATEGNKR